MKLFSAGKAIVLAVLSLGVSLSANAGKEPCDHCVDGVCEKAQCVYDADGNRMMFDMNGKRINEYAEGRDSEDQAFTGGFLAKSKKKVHQDNDFVTDHTANQGDGYAARCGYVEIKKGYLSDSIRDSIARCGYKIGRWDFGTDREEEDWEIINPFSFQSTDSSIEGVIATIEQTYGIRGEINERDSTVDFSLSGNLVRIKR